MISTVAALGQRVIENVGRVIIGKDAVTELILVALLCEGHVLIEDVPGVGKTTLARAVARSIGGQFRRIQFMPDLLPSDITGLTFFNQRTGEFQFRAGPVFTNVLLADEINRATPRTQSALLEAMQERTVTIEGETIPLPRPFLVLATENPVEIEGTFPLPEAQLDRFLLRTVIGYPEPAEEVAMLARFQERNPLDELEPVTTPEELLRAAAACRSIYVEDDLRWYIAEIARATRRHEAIELGVSPRGTLALFHCAQALAAIRGRDFVLPDDVKELVTPVLAHRIILSPEARLRGRDARQLLEEIVETVNVPVEQL
uniref:MoxR family ATPase n=1 Tax=Thermorudis peleae TaxID=1382356 RepID=A0A831X0Q7_9BACT